MKIKKFYISHSKWENMIGKSMKSLVFTRTWQRREGLGPGLHETNFLPANYAFSQEERHRASWAAKTLNIIEDVMGQCQPSAASLLEETLFPECGDQSQVLKESGDSCARRFTHREGGNSCARWFTHKSSRPCVLWKLSLKGTAKELPYLHRPLPPSVGTHLSKVLWESGTGHLC